ncbi:MAG: hypothetical protein LHW57_04645 [Candidatus Cloacimonetes bacterium]|nr:hypothetical protein [Candidatus Cloacimonadota bacterium]
MINKKIVIFPTAPKRAELVGSKVFMVTPESFFDYTIPRDLSIKKLPGCQAGDVQAQGGGSEFTNKGFDKKAAGKKLEQITG